MNAQRALSFSHSLSLFQRLLFSSLFFVVSFIHNGEICANADGRCCSCSRSRIYRPSSSLCILHATERCIISSHRSARALSRVQCVFVRECNCAIGLGFSKPRGRPTRSPAARSHTIDADRRLDGWPTPGSDFSLHLPTTVTSTDHFIVMTLQLHRFPTLMCVMMMIKRLLQFRARR